MTIANAHTEFEQFLTTTDEAEIELLCSRLLLVPQISLLGPILGLAALASDEHVSMLQILRKVVETVEE